MDLTINHMIYTTDSMVACDSIIWNGNVYDSTGIYVDTLQTIAGCDSIITLDLIVNYSTVSYDSLEACNSLKWNGTKYFSSGNFM